MKQRWPRTELPNSGLKIITANLTRWFLIKLSREKSVSKLTSNNTNSLTNSGTKTCSRSRRKTHKLLANWKTDTLKKLKGIGRNWRTNCP